MVSVELRGRPFASVAADMVDGVLVANRVRGDQVERLRRAFVDVLRAPPEPSAPPPRAPTLSPGARMAERQTQAA